jgi:4-alpha-glucanotransferase
VDDHHLRERAAAHGVLAGYHAIDGTWIEPPVETLRLVLDAIGVEPDEPAHGEAGAATAAIVARPGAPRAAGTLAGREVRLEDGTERRLPDELPGDLPPGYHAIDGPAGPVHLVVAPDRAHLPERLRDGGRAAGLALQLYALRSAVSLGIGDVGDLARLVQAVPQADFVLLNPLHAPRPGDHQQPSPYYASSRRFRNPLFVAADAVPEVAALQPGERSRFDALLAEGRALDDLELIDRDRALAVKDAALALCHAALEREPARRARLDAALAGDTELLRYATFCAIAEAHPGHWSRWPNGLGDAGSAAVAAYGAGHATRVRHHAYLQLALAEQLAALPPLRLGYVYDLAVGTAGDGYDAWSLGRGVALGMKVGAPPDRFSPHGQDWGLPPLAPRGLTERGYADVAAMLRANMAHAAGLRVDHVMAFFRLFWIPAGRPASEGTYVRYPAEDLLGVLALESRRARCLVIGEDLGTVEDGVRETLAARDVLSYRLAWFEDRPPEAYPRLAMAAVTTHDLPTIDGFFSGADLAQLHAIGVIGDDDLAAARARQEWDRGLLRGRLANAGILPEHEGDGDDVAVALHALLARTPCMLVAASLDDVVGAPLRANVPGTVDEHPNWRLPLPARVEDVAAKPRLARIMDALAPARLPE